MPDTPKESVEPVPARGEAGFAPGDFFRRDRFDAAFLIAGFLLTVLSLVGAYVQRPSSNPKPSRISWLVEPLERNVFLKFPSLGAPLTGVHFDGLQVGWVVGASGTILYTTDGGQSWQPQTNANKNNLRSIYGTGDGQTLWAVGENGTILHTANGGQSWQPQTNANKNSLFSIYATGDGQTLWAVGENGTILHTANGGQSWQPQTNANKNSLFSIYGTGDSQTLWAVGENGIILHTANGGQSWQPQTNADKNDLLSIYGTGDGKTLWAVGRLGTILHTANGGQSWQPQSNSNKNDLLSIHGTRDGKTLWAVGRLGTILHTANGGQSWEPQTNANKNELSSIYGNADSTTLWAVGRFGTILRTTDGGQSWEPQTNAHYSDLSSIRGSGGDTLWAVGRYGTILQTTDGGQSWQPQTNADKNDLSFIYTTGDGDALWAVGDNGTILHTTDGGQSWQPQTSPAKVDLYSIYGTEDGKTLWAVGDIGTILHTTDGGQSWQLQTNADKNDLLSIYGTGDGKTLWAAGFNGTIRHTTDGGQSWQPQTNADKNDLFSIYGIGDGKTLWAVGFNGTILHTADGGQSWQPQTNADKDNLLSIYGIGDGKTLWAVGGNGTILHTADGGQSWRPQTSADKNNLYSIYGTGDGKTLWAVGRHYDILRTADGGSTWTNLRSTSPYSYRPALWVWLTLAAAICLIIIGSVRLSRPLPASKQSIENAGLSDQPATKLVQDLLDVADTVRCLVEFLRNRNTEPPVTISVEGQWGIGKTSVMRMLESELRRARVPTVWFNAWHNEGEEQMLAFLLESIREKAFPAWWNIREIDFRLRLLVIRFERWWIILLALAVAALFIVHPTLDWLFGLDTEDERRFHIFVDWLRDLNWKQYAAIATAAGASYPLVRKVLRSATGISVQPSDLLSDSDSKSNNAARTSFRTRFAREFQEAVQALGPDRRIAIFIDDLDRCQPEQVRQTLEAVNFLISSAGCFVIMGIAREVVEASVGLGFKEIAEELVELNAAEDAAAANPPVPLDKEQASKQRRRAFARNYLLKLINLTVLLRPYSGDLLANVATSSLKMTDRPALLRQAAPYALIASTILATALLWNAQMIPPIRPERKVLQEESYELPGALDEKNLKSLVVERDEEGKVVGEKRTYDVDEKPLAEKLPDTGEKPLPVLYSPHSTDPRDSQSQGVDFQLGQSYGTSHWLWWMLPLLAGATGVAIRAFFFRRQRPIQDSAKFRDALRLWRTVYESEIRTPREIKRFVNELRYKAIRFRGLQPTVPVVGKISAKASDNLSVQEPTLILIAILERLNRGKWDEDPMAATAWLPEPFRKTFMEHVERFGKPSAEDYKRYHALFGQE